MPLPEISNNNIDDIFEETLTYMPDMESELLSFKQISGGDSPEDLKVDELYSQLQSLFGDITLTKKSDIVSKLNELDKAVE